MTTKDGLKRVVDSHKKWLNNENGGERADLSAAILRGADLSAAILRGANLYGADLSAAILRGADLRDANLRGANLCGANLYGADLYGADLSAVILRGADLRDANLRGANLYGADLSAADLYGADLCGADLRDADLYGADLCGADLRDADLYGADLCDANLRGAKHVPFIPMSCPDTGSFIGWKKARYGRIVKLSIPEDARRSSAAGRKCRCDKAEVLSIESIDGSESFETAQSDYDHEFVYTVGAVVSVPDFDKDRFKECAPGIHFFINRQEAIDYIL